MYKRGICSQIETLLLSLISEVSRGCELIANLDDLTYRKPANGTGSVGSHFRHNLDLINNFLNGISQERIDYCNRERDLRVEADRGYAIERFNTSISRIGALAHKVPGRLIYIRSEGNPSSWLASSVARELEFLHSHTVHHHALIAEKLAGIGVAVTIENFGVAPSTLQYWRTMAA